MTKKMIIRTIVVIWAITLNVMGLNAIRNADADDVKTFVHTVSDLHPQEIRTRDGKKIEWRIDYQFYRSLDQYFEES